VARVPKLVDRISRRQRERRWTTLRQLIDFREVRTILDLGGSVDFWRKSGLTHLPLEVTCLNLTGTETVQRDEQMTISLVIGDATRPQFDPAAFDLVFSNSVIEHVGAWPAVEAMAGVLRRGQRYFLQTPNRGFFVEPHFILPFHWALPRPAKIAVLRVWDRGPKRRTYAQASKRVDSIRLLDRSELTRLFPHGEIVVERSLGFVKSFMVFGTGDLTAEAPPSPR
jgi:hypothetical protein